MRKILQSEVAEGVVIALALTVSCPDANPTSLVELHWMTYVITPSCEKFPPVTVRAKSMPLETSNSIDPL